MVIFSAALRGVPQDTIEAATIDGANPFQMFFRVKLPRLLDRGGGLDHARHSCPQGFDIPYALSANDDDKLLLATMMENARNNWSIGGDNVDNLFAAIAIMLMLTVIPNMVFNAGVSGASRRGSTDDRPYAPPCCSWTDVFIWVVPFVALVTTSLRSNLRPRPPVSGHPIRRPSSATVSAPTTRADGRGHQAHRQHLRTAEQGRAVLPDFGEVRSILFKGRVPIRKIPARPS